MAAEAPRTGFGNCNTALPPADRQLPVDTSTPGYQMFVDQVMPFLFNSCAYGTCHSSPQADFYLTCGDSPDQLRFNYGQAAGFVVPSGTAVEQSEILLRPLSALAGGVSHTGGVFFKSRDDLQWKMVKDWAVLVQMTPPLGPVVKTAGQTFFEERVMPKLLQRGCALEGCHSPDGFNDFRLRSGANGSFAPLALRRNYEAALDEFMALDTIDVKQSRAVKKNIAAASGGIVHRAGPILEDAVSDRHRLSAAVRSPDGHARLLRVQGVASHRAGRSCDRGVAYDVRQHRDTGVRVPSAQRGTLLEFDTFAGGADLKLADATLDANGGVMSVGNIRSGLGRVQPASPPAPPTSAARSGATTARRSSSRAGRVRAAGWICGCWTSAPQPAGSSRPATASWPAR